MSTVAEQLTTLLNRLKMAGWKRLNGNTWRSGTYTLRTAYTWGEATLELAHDKQAKGFSAPTHYYRGSEPLTWANIESAPVLRKIFAK